MITVSIGGISVPIEKAGEGWINQMIQDARKRGVPLCVQVRVQIPGVDIALSSPGCGNVGGGGRPPNETERKIFDAWNRRGLSEPEFHPGSVRAFLNDLARLI